MTYFTFFCDVSHTRTRCRKSKKEINKILIGVNRFVSHHHKTTFVYFLLLLLLLLQFSSLPITSKRTNQKKQNWCEEHYWKHFFFLLDIDVHQVLILLRTLLRDAFSVFNVQKSVSNSEILVSCDVWWHRVVHFYYVCHHIV